MSVPIQVISIAAAVLFSYVMLVKVGLPWFLAGIIAPIAGFIVWRWENAGEGDEPKWAVLLSSLKDLKDISKYLNHIF